MPLPITFSKENRTQQRKQSIQKLKNWMKTVSSNFKKRFQSQTSLQIIELQDLNPSLTNSAAPTAVIYNPPSTNAIVETKREAHAALTPPPVAIATPAVAAPVKQKPIQPQSATPASQRTTQPSATQAAPASTKKQTHSSTTRKLANTLQSDLVNQVTTRFTTITHEIQKQLNLTENFSRTLNRDIADRYNNAAQTIKAGIEEIQTQRRNMHRWRDSISQVTPEHKLDDSASSRDEIIDSPRATPAPVAAAPVTATQAAVSHSPIIPPRSTAFTFPPDDKLKEKIDAAIKKFKDIDRKVKWEDFQGYLLICLSIIMMSIIARPIENKFELSNKSFNIIITASGLAAFLFHYFSRQSIANPRQNQLAGLFHIYTELTKSSSANTSDETVIELLTVISPYLNLEDLTPWANASASDDERFKDVSEDFLDVIARPPHNKFYTKPAAASLNFSNSSVAEHSLFNSQRQERNPSGYSDRTISSISRSMYGLSSEKKERVKIEVLAGSSPRNRV